MNEWDLRRKKNCEKIQIILAPSFIIHKFLNNLDHNSFEWKYVNSLVYLYIMLYPCLTSFEWSHAFKMSFSKFSMYLSLIYCKNSFKLNFLCFNPLLRIVQCYEHEIIANNCLNHLILDLKANHRRKWSNLINIIFLNVLQLEL